MQRIQKKLYKAYGKVAKKMGELYEVFRPEPFFLKLEDANYIDTKYVSVSKDTTYSTSPAAHKAAMYKLWIDGRLEKLFDIQRGDHLINPETGRTFFVSYAELNLPLEAIECNAEIDIYNVEDTDYQSGVGVEFRPNTEPDNVDVVRNHPAYVGVVGASEIDGGFIPGRSTYGHSRNEYELYFWLPAGAVTNGSVITVNDGVKISAQQVFYGPAGYYVKGIEVA